MMVVTEIRSTHPYAFRPGVWAAITDIEWFEPDGLEPRYCYRVRFPEDGFVDYLPIENSGYGYEFRVLGPKEEDNDSDREPDSVAR